MLEHQEPFYLEPLKYLTKIYKLAFRNQKIGIAIVKENKEGP
jgi:hypothetical protein